MNKQEAITDTKKVSEQDDTSKTDVSSADAPVSVDNTKLESKKVPHNEDKTQRRSGKQRRGRRGGRREERSRPEFDQKIISIRRVTRVVAGGRRFSFSVAIVIGDKKGRVGVGLGKAGDTQLAIEKAARKAKKEMISVVMDSDGHIPHDVHVKFASSEVMIMPAPGRGLVAGSSVRTVLELAGVKNVTAKLFSRSKNKLNNAQAAIMALKKLQA